MALTPMMRQYQEIKATLDDTLLMFRLGDFYELFFDDAVVASRALDITLTGRDAGEAGRIPMCGVPYHALEGYLERLIEQGFRVAICEQIEDPKTAKGLVQREIVRIVTPGTALSKEQDNRFLGALAPGDTEHGLAFVDVGTGEVMVGLSSMEACLERIQLWRPIELLLPGSYEVPLDLQRVLDESQLVVTRRAFRIEGVLEQQYGVAAPEALGMAAGSLSHQALEATLVYLRDTQKVTLRHLQGPRPMFEHAYMELNQTAIGHLELIASARDRSKKGSLLGLLDKSITAGGGRMLKAWLERPLRDRTEIERRHDVVSFFYDDLILREEVRQSLRGVHDLARLLAKFSFGSANARDAKALVHSLDHAALAVECLQSATLPDLLNEEISGLPDLTEFRDTVRNQIVDEPPVSIREGGMFKMGVHPELDRLRTLQSSGRTWLRDLEVRERERTGIKSLKIGYNKVFGYYIEVSKSNLQNVPADYERRQTLASAERFVLPELKAREEEILSAEERAIAFELELFQALAQEVIALGSAIQRWADAVARIDVLSTLAQVATEYRYVRPVMRDEVGIEIEAGRHPVVEAHAASPFVPNDASLTPDRHIILLTGPNMGGKSTYMRQTAVICVMAQMGGFVPAKQATIGIVDRIFARIGASDDLNRGQSTFMVEMIELAEILRTATGRSLVLLDEIGRGTSTYDGLSIAEAVLEELAVRKERPLTMFATHYHELVGFSRRFPGVKNHSMAVEESQDGIRFLHTVVDRPSDKSYGIQVARLAGLPTSVIERAQTLLEARETVGVEGADSIRDRSLGALSDAGQEVAAAKELLPEPLPPLALFAGPTEAFAQEVAQLDVLNMTPIAAMNRIHELVEKARKLVQWETSS
ncbi:DNA mismatch repair protein MutS [Alicyclobacillus acidiphilus]|uniref:DNA mismatch repair protein MutS n=1 Tax=Alicyclobacillus acidiphilus TaxID=182455 RepID=UPI00083565DD|nr:DNA mismatch repair protein MutS [Alicyclobacillus acidiphilus]